MVVTVCFVREAPAIPVVWEFSAITLLNVRSDDSSPATVSGFFEYDDPGGTGPPPFILQDFSIDVTGGPSPFGFTPDNSWFISSPRQSIPFEFSIEEKLGPHSILALFNPPIDSTTESSIVNFTYKDRSRARGQRLFNGSGPIAAATPTPEPTTMLLLGTGLAVFIGFRKKLMK
jgi:hypothetical protein